VVFRNVVAVAGLAISSVGTFAQAANTYEVDTFPQEVQQSITAADGLPSKEVVAIHATSRGIIAETTEGAVILRNGAWQPVGDERLPGEELIPEIAALTNAEILDAAALPGGGYVIGASTGLMMAGEGGQYMFIYPQDGMYSWAPRPVQAVTVDADGNVWFASPQGVGRYDGDSWTLWTGDEGLPYNDFTCMAAAPDGAVWFGTTKGAIRYDGEDFRYRQGKRWLPADDVRDIAVDDAGAAWIATSGGVSRIGFEEMTLAEKAEHYEDLIDKYNRRTEFGYVLQARFNEPGDYDSGHSNHDSDNDGLWTGMYGAGECFAYAATGSEDARERARLAWKALKHLGDVTQGGEPPALEGFVARTVLPTSGPNPNEGHYTPERDRERQKEDALWKVITPRWPVSEDGEWYWKSDTSSDELDGHYFFYGVFYDHVANDDEKAQVRERVAEITDHLVSQGFNLVDHDGKPTRWARYSPEELNFSKDWWVERGLNSLSMLSYLATAAHITGDDKYIDTARYLIDEHGYAQNLLVPKIQRGIGTGNQSDDEMAFMCYYNLMKYWPGGDDLLERSALSWWSYWRLERPEQNPFFNFAFAAMCTGMTFDDPWGTHDVSPTGDWLEESMETLFRFPLDRFDWRHENDHRLDIIQLPEWKRGFDEDSISGYGYRPDGNVVPVDERHFNHWNHNPFRLNTGGSGHGLSDGAVYLLPYYMGLYHGFIVEQ